MPKTCARCFILMLLLAVVAIAENPDRLSVEDSLLLVAKQVPYSNGEWISRAQRANPDARATLYRVIDRPTANESRIQAGLLFRYIGDASDVRHLLDRMKATVVPASSEDTQYLFRMTYVFGDMYRRGVTEAGQALDAMVRPSYWKERKTKLSYRDQPGGLSSESDCALEALRAWAKAAPDQIATKATILSDAVVDAEQTRVVKPWIDDIVARAGKPEPIYGVPLAPTSRPATSASVTFDWEVKKARESRLEPVDGEVASLVVQALAAYDAGEKAVRRGDYSYLVPHLANKGRPVLRAGRDASAINKLVQRDKLKSAMSRTVQLMGSVAAANPTRGQPVVKST